MKSRLRPGVSFREQHLQLASGGWTRLLVLAQHGSCIRAASPPKLGSEGAGSGWSWAGARTRSQGKWAFVFQCHSVGSRPSGVLRATHTSELRTLKPEPWYLSRRRRGIPAAVCAPTCTGVRAHTCRCCARYTLRVCVCKCAALRRARLAQAIAPLDRRRVGSLRHSWTAHARARAAVCARTLWKWKPGRLAPVRCGNRKRREGGGRAAAGLSGLSRVFVCH